MKEDASGAVVLAPGDDGYQLAATRGLYPSPAPAFIVQVNSSSHIAVAVKCAGDENLKVCARSGGHSFAGLSTCTGVMIDVVKMKALDFDSATNQVTLETGNTLGDMFYGVLTQSGGSRMIGIGLCPGVGVAGYILGGGFNPYSGQLGLTCESLVEAEYVLPDGTLTKASASQNQELFWASCGGGGGHFGVVYRVTLRTHDASIFNNNVFFRYQWPNNVAGEVMSKWMDYDNENGMVWVRTEANTENGFVAYGACWNANSVAACESRLSAADFFNVPGRKAVLTKKSSRVAEFQAFIGPYGKWARQVAPESDKEALVGQNYLDAGVGFKRLYTSAFWKFGKSKPSVSELQKLIDICLDVDKSKLDFMVCQFNPWTGKQSNTAGDYAFAHRDMDAFSEFIGGKDSASSAGEVAATFDELKRVNAALREIFLKYFAGLYVNYPEFGLSQSDWQYLYWRDRLPRLAALKGKLDPSGRLAVLHGLPSGRASCPGPLKVTGSGARKSVAIQGYDLGQLTGMTATFRVSYGCTVNTKAVDGASVSSVGGNVYEAVVNGINPFSVTLSSPTCKITTEKVNNIPCNA